MSVGGCRRAPPRTRRGSDTNDGPSLKEGACTRSGAIISRVTGTEPRCATLRGHQRQACFAGTPTKKRTGPRDSSPRHHKHAGSFITDLLPSLPFRSRGNRR
jgi:hypothetical protein